MILKTYFNDLDLSLNGGLTTSSLVIVGARPAMGKTTLLTSIAANLIRKGDKFLFCSLEEKAESINSKILSNLAEIPFDSVQFLKPNKAEKERIDLAVKMIRDCESYINDERDLSVIEEEIMRLKGDIKIVFIENIQILSKTSSYEDITRTMMRLKDICHQKDICIIVSSHLSRAVDERQGHRPRLTDLRDCGGIEEIADQVFLLLRREYYDPMDKPGIAELIIGKNRLGRADASIFLTYRKEIGEFCNFVPLKRSWEVENETAFSAFNPP